LSQFKETLQQWKSWDSIAIIQNHQLIKEHLWDLFQRGLTIEVCFLRSAFCNYTADIFQSGSALHSEETFHNLVTLDKIAVYAHLTVWVTDDSKYQHLLTQRGQVAQSLVNLLQEVRSFALSSPRAAKSAHSDQRLDIPMEPQYRSRHVKALLKLSRASGLHPESLALKGIEMEMHPVDNGGYGDVYQGMLHGRKIAVKVLKVYQSSDLVKLLKVVFEY